MASRSSRFTIAGGGPHGQVMTWGAVLQDLRLDGHERAAGARLRPLRRLSGASPYFGAVAGRYANRIRDGRFTIAGKRYQIDRNFLGKHTLHGGSAGFSAAGLGGGAARRDFVALALPIPTAHGFSRRARRDLHLPAEDPRHPVGRTDRRPATSRRSATSLITPISTSTTAAPATSSTTG